MTPHLVFILIRLICECLAMVAIIAGLVAGVVIGIRWLLSLRGRSRAELLKIGACSVLGPITGPLVAGVVRNVRKGRPFVAAIWALAIPLAWAGVASAATMLAHATVL
jgi:hypothetical protein